MIRILFAAALGGLTTLFILAATDSAKFMAWAEGFGIAAAILLPLMILGLFLKSGAKKQQIYQDAKANGRIKAALILDRRQTGTFVNEQPQVQFTLLVDRSGRRPFVTTARAIVSLLDMHQIVPGQLIAVAHPDPDFSNVHPLTGETPPTPSQTLTPEAASSAAELPAQKTGASPSFVTALVAAFLISAIGAPFLVTPNPLPYVQYLLGGKQGSVSRLDHAFLFEADELEKSLEAMTAELGQDKVAAVQIFESSLDAEVQEAPDSLKIDSVTVRDHEIIEREPYGELEPEMLEEYAGGPFNVFDVNWRAVLDRVPEAAKLAEAQGLNAPELHAISAQPGDSSLAPIEVHLGFRDDHGYSQLYLTPDGEIAANEKFALLPEAERAAYFYDAENFRAAAQEMLDTVGAEEILEITNFGDRLYLDAFIPAESGVGTGQSVSMTYREGRLADVEAPESTKASADERFSLDDLDWVSVYGSITTAQQIMADAGAEETEPSHIIMRRDDIHSTEGNETFARIYLSNVLDEGGYVVVYGDGSIGRVSGP